MKLVPKDKREPGWPKSCLESWLESFKRWEKMGRSYDMSPGVIAAMAHNLQCNLLYIEELEEEVEALKPAGCLDVEEYYEDEPEPTASLDFSAALKAMKEGKRVRGAPGIWGDDYLIYCNGEICCIFGGQCSHSFTEIPATWWVDDWAIVPEETEDEQ